MTGTEWNTKKETIHQDFLWALEPEATHQITRSEYQNEPDNIKIEKLINLYHRYYLPKRNKNNSRGDFLGKTNRYGNTGRPLREINRIRKRMRFSKLQHRITYIKIYNINHRQEITGQTGERKGLRYTKSSQQIQQNTYDRKNKKNTIPEALISKREKDIKEEPIPRITHTGQYGKRPKKRPKDQNCRRCEAPNWNPNHKCPAREPISYKCKKKGHMWKHVHSNTENDKKLKKLGVPRRPRRTIPTSQYIEKPEQNT